jgi:hypothetical protein
MPIGTGDIVRNVGERRMFNSPDLILVDIVGMLNLAKPTYPFINFFICAMGSVSSSRKKVKVIRVAEQCRCI